MKQELQEKLFGTYPKIFADRDKTVQESAMCRGFCCWDGWYEIIDTLCSLLQKATDDTGEEQAVAFQVKEKFGTLRFYLNHTTDLQRVYIIFATAMSEKVCEYCGSFDNVKKRSGGLVRTTCDTCDEKIKKND